MEKGRIAVFGAGAFGEEVYLLVEKINRFLPAGKPRWEFVGFFDDNLSLAGSNNSYGPVLGGTDALNAFEGPLSVAFGIGSSAAIQSIVSRITKKDILYPNLIDPDTSFLDRDSVVFGQGNVVGEGCRFSPKSRMGNFNIVVNDCVFGHDSVVGDYNIFFPEVRVSGKAVVGNGCLMGMRSAVFQGIKVGDGVRLAAGSILSMNARPGCTYMGNPARMLKI